MDSATTNAALTEAMQLLEDTMTRMHRKLGRAANQAQGIRADLLEQLLAGTEADVRGLRDRALLMSKGRWGKSDTVMRYVEQVGFVA